MYLLMSVEKSPMMHALLARRKHLLLEPQLGSYDSNKAPETATALNAYCYFVCNILFEH